MLSLCHSAVIIIICSFLRPYPSQADFEDCSQWISDISANKIDVCQRIVSKWNVSSYWHYRFSADVI